MQFALCPDMFTLCFFHSFFITLAAEYGGTSITNRMQGESILELSIGVGLTQATVLGSGSVPFETVCWNTI